MDRNLNTWYLNLIFNILCSIHGDYQSDIFGDVKNMSDYFRFMLIITFNNTSEEYCITKLIILFVTYKYIMLIIWH